MPKGFNQSRKFVRGSRDLRLPGLKSHTWRKDYNETWFHHIIGTDEMGYAYKQKEFVVRDILHIKHNAGFFSCMSIALQDIMIWFNSWQRLPEEVRRDMQFMYYKHRPDQNLIPMLFMGSPSAPDSGTTDAVVYHNGFNVGITSSIGEFQYTDYKYLLWDCIDPFIARYFVPSNTIHNRIRDFESMYGFGEGQPLPYDNICGVFYRGNDKCKETPTGPIEVWLKRAADIKERNPDVRFLVLPDEREFLDAFMEKFPDSIFPSQWPVMLRNTDIAHFMQLPYDKRPEHAVNFFAAVLCMARCRHVILHSGNGAFWVAAYRGHGENMHQFLTRKFLHTVDNA
jgi:hypothetical protein